MDAARRDASPFPPLRHFASTAVFAALFLLCIGFLYRAVSRTEVVVVPPDGPAGAAVVMQQLDRLDADYRLRKDGRIAVDGADAALLMQGGFPVADEEGDFDTGRKALLLLPVLLFGFLTAFSARRAFQKYRDRSSSLRWQPAETSGPPEAASAETPSALQAAAGNVRSAPVLFEGEHSQAVAVYLLGSETAAAAAALEAMPLQQRGEVWRRMACSGACDPALGRKVAELFEAKRQKLQRRRRPPEAAAKMAAILRRLSPETRAGLTALLRRQEDGDEIIALLEA